MKNIIRTILLLLIIATFATIFLFSNQEGKKSKGISGHVAEVIISIQGKDKNITAEEKEELIEVYQPIIRKGAHFLIYTILGIGLITFMTTIEIENKKRILLTIVIGTIYAISDEIHQIFIPGRTAQIADVLIDSIGVVIGMLIVLLFTTMLQFR